MVSNQSRGAHTQDPLSWGWPLLWVVFIPVVTVPATMWLLNLLVDSNVCIPVTPTGFSPLQRGSYCPVSLALVALTPGLLNLVPATRLRAPQPRARSAATVATVLGSIRLVAPAVVLLTSWPQVLVETGLGVIDLDITSIMIIYFGLLGMIVSPLLWVVTVVVSLRAFVLLDRIDNEQSIVVGDPEE
jgi:hypothetical protein